MLAQMIWSTIVYLFLTSLGAPRTNKNNNVVNLYHQMFSFFHLLQLKGVSSLTSWIEIIKWREFDAAAEYIRVKCCLALACTVGLCLALKRNSFLTRVENRDFVFVLFFPKLFQSSIGVGRNSWSSSGADETTIPILTFPPPPLRRLYLMFR